MNIDWMPGAIGAFVKKEGGRVLQVLTATRDDNCVLIGNPGFVGQRADGGGDYHVFSEHWRWVPRAVEWNGEGLPPVDIPCEWHSDFQAGWQVVTVLAYHGDQAWIQPEGRESIIVGNPANFRPLRTPEQIAADEREHAIRNACTTIARTLDQFRNDIACANAARAVVEALHDAGYRKQVTP